MSKEEPVRVCRGSAEYYLCTIVRRAIIRAIESLKIVWPAGRKCKVIV